MEITPTPTEDEVAAILAAYQILREANNRVQQSHNNKSEEEWRFSGRWWSKQKFASRDLGSRL